MGSILSCAGECVLGDAFDIEGAVPVGDRDNQIIQLFQTTVVDRWENLSQQLISYNNCRDLVADIIHDPNSENSEQAIEAVTSNVRLADDLYEFSVCVVGRFWDLFSFIIDAMAEQGIIALSTYAAIVRSIATLFDIILQHDSLHLATPNLSFDISFFRRIFQRHPPQVNDPLHELLRKTDDLTVHFAKHLPLLSRVSKDLSATYTTPATMAPSLQLLSILIDGCCGILSNGTPSEATGTICARCVTCAILLYDYCSTTGAFCRGVPFNSVAAVRLIAGYQPLQDSLVKTLRYSSKHLSDPSTLPQIRAILLES